jgi:hypothetical protein
MARKKSEKKISPQTKEEDQITNDLYMPFDKAMKKIIVFKKDSETASFIPPKKKK